MTALIEIGGWRLLTDPTFDEPGRRYSFGWGSGSRKTAGPALPARRRVGRARRSGRAVPARSPSHRR